MSLLTYKSRSVHPVHLYERSRDPRAFILGGFGIIVSGFLLFPAVMVRDWWAVWGGLFVAIGAGAGVYFVHAGGTDIE